MKDRKFRKHIYKVLQEAKEKARTDRIYIFNSFMMQYVSVYGNGEKKQAYKDKPLPLRTGCMVEEIEHLIVTPNLTILVLSDAEEYIGHPYDTGEWLTVEYKVMDNPVLRAKMQRDIYIRSYSAEGVSADNVIAVVLLKATPETMYPQRTGHKGVYVLTDDDAAIRLACMIDEADGPRYTPRLMERLTEWHRHVKDDPDVEAACGRAIERAVKIRRWVMTHERRDLFALTDVAFCPRCGARLMFCDVMEQDSRRNNIRPTKQYVLRHAHRDPAYEYKYGPCRFEMRYSNKKDEGFKTIKDTCTMEFGKEEYFRLKKQELERQKEASQTEKYNIC